MVRYCQDRPLPPYTYVTGRSPHPMSDPEGHSYGIAHLPPQALDHDNYRGNQDYLYAIDLFNHGYYWEAHEAWESLWHAAGRQGSTADFLKGLIKLAAAGVKLKEGRPEGVRRHLLRALELLQALPQLRESVDGRVFGLALDSIFVELQLILRDASEQKLMPPDATRILPLRLPL